MKKNKSKTPPYPMPKTPDRWHFLDSLVKEKVTKQKLSAYVASFRTIKVTPIENDEPIFILKNQHKKNNIYGYMLILPTNAKVIIHNDNFIWSDAKTCGVGVLVYKKKTEAQPLPTERVADDDYIKKYENKAYPSKEFLIKNVIDKELPLYGTQYIKPIKDLFKKYGILAEMRRGHWEKVHIIEERRQFVRAQLRAIAAGKIEDKSISGICERWESYVQQKNFKDEKEADKYTCNYIDIYRDVQALKKLHRN